MIFDDEIERLRRKKNGMNLLCNMLAKKLEGNAERNANWKDRTSHARQGISGGSFSKGTVYTIYLSYGVDYGEILEKGSKPHEIHWRNRVFHHPGTKGFHTFENTLEENKDEVINTVLNYWKD